MHFIMPRFFVNCERWKWNNDLRIYVSTHGHVKDEYKKNIAAKINDLLEGNIREIISQITLKELIQGDKKVFAEKVVENVEPNLRDMGL